MVVASRQVSGGYFDHPPMAFWIARAAAVLGGEHALVVRLPFILLFAATTWLMYRLTARLFGERAGVIAALLLNVSAVFAISTGGWVLPDGPLAFGLAAAAYCLARATLGPLRARPDRPLQGGPHERQRSDPDEPHPTMWWIATGVCTGIALLSKYHALLFMAGAFAFLALRPSQRYWLRKPGPYLAAAVALAMFLPDILWNARHHWASFAFQLGRNTSSTSVPLATRLAALGQTLGGQILWVLPWIWLPLVVVAVRAIRRRPADDREWLLLCLAAGPIVVFTLVSLGGHAALPHWAAPGYLMLFPLLGADAGRCNRPLQGQSHAAPGHAALGPGTRRWIVGSVAAFVGLMALLLTATATGWPARVAPALVARNDPTLEMLDWADLPHGLDSLGVLRRPNTFVAGTSWIQAAKVAYALGPGVHVLCLSVDPRHFGFLEDERAYLGQDAIIVTRLPARPDVETRYAPYFQRVETVGQVPIRRAGRAELAVGVYVAHDFRGMRRADAGGSRPAPTRPPLQALSGLSSAP